MPDSGRKCSGMLMMNDGNRRIPQTRDTNLHTWKKIRKTAGTALLHCHTSETMTPMATYISNC
eukprot:1162036-Pelagomonas_calceolata.AAC.18